MICCIEGDWSETRHCRRGRLAYGLSGSYDRRRAWSNFAYGAAGQFIPRRKTAFADSAGYGGRLPDATLARTKPGRQSADWYLGMSGLPENDGRGRIA